MKFTPANGRIQISTMVEGPFARLEVADTGLGVPAESLKNIFELFGQDESGYSVGQRRVGLGIGLALVRELVEAHGGRVAASSPGQDQGATFTVWIPLAPATTEPPPQGQAAPSALAVGTFSWWTTTLTA